MVGRQARLHVDIILGIPHTDSTVDTEGFNQYTRKICISTTEQIDAGKQCVASIPGV